ncbi:hypothetical protein LNP74_21890 [Klebsiella pneumoniae subsp. pneumoniae]|nr:hypothetical protein [Klebsiella pneumoniae subsp. pneumoniae]
MKDALKGKVQETLVGGRYDAVLSQQRAAYLELWHPAAESYGTEAR